MTETVSEYTGRLIVVRCWCGIQHAVPSALREEQLRRYDAGSSMSVYCPLGHEYYPAEISELVKLERKLIRERACHDQTKAKLQDTEKRRQTQKAATTRLKRRVSAGVCPCCTRTFKQLARHMATQHPGYRKSLGGK